LTRIFKLKGFARFQRKERIGDGRLRKALGDIEAGLIDADLGGGLVKQRLARAGQGKRAGYRMVIAFRRGERVVFLYGFAKNERANIDAEELEEFQRLARGYFEMTQHQIDMLIADDELMEVDDDDEF
jgi:hypothetical protein